MRLYFLFIFSFCCVLICEAQLRSRFPVVQQLDSMLYLDRNEKVYANVELLLKNSENVSQDERNEYRLVEGITLIRIRQFQQAIGKLLLLDKDLANSNNYRLQLLTKLYLAVLYEVQKDFPTCKNYLDQVETLLQNHPLDELYSSFCVRSASYNRFVGNKKLLEYYARMAIVYALRYQQVSDLEDAYFLLSLQFEASQYEDKASLNSKILTLQISRQNYKKAAFSANNIAKSYLLGGKYERALEFNDSAIHILEKGRERIPITIYENRAAILEKLNRFESAIAIYKKIHELSLQEQAEMERIAIKRITEEFNSEKQQAIIKRKNLTLNFLIGLGVLLILFALVVLYKNRKINRQNSIIQKQVSELELLLSQKDVLLSEVQHRVKNNLQHVISILDMQEESLAFNSIEEIFRENKNRIHSMAVLHRKLSVNREFNEVNVGNYINELSTLVADSYYNANKKLALTVDCVEFHLPINTAHAIGLIVVEFLSNSYKHAFNQQPEGEIKLSIIRLDEGRIKLLYKDNGSGYNPKVVNSKGLGNVIINGLIAQLNGELIIHEVNIGFEASIIF